MRRLERRAIICLTLAAVLFIGLTVFVYRYVAHGNEWATFYGNRSIYKNGQLKVGRIYDVNDLILADNSDQGRKYCDDPVIRTATVHAVGDKDGNISTSAQKVFADKLVGYNLLTGTYSLTGKGREIRLTIDADICKTAYQAMAGRKGLVGVYNYRTGDIICMVSTPAFDPETHKSGTNEVSGMYLNKFLSSKMVPGSIFKLVTSAAAIENLDNMDSWSYNCTGSTVINGEKLNCMGVHGRVNFQDALAKSCNCAYAELSQKIGADTMKEYVDKLGLTEAYDIDGAFNTKGTFEFPDNAYNLSWAGIGQYKDQLNPCSMMVYMGAIANGGKGVVPNLVKQKIPVSEKTSQMVDESTALKLKNMMKNNVVKTYGEYRFPGLDIYAKSGTAEVSTGAPNAWFTGFIKNENKPYAFIVCVENGGLGSQAAGAVANTVLQKIVNKD